MTTVKVKFIHYEWDNYQGASGKVFEREKLITIEHDIKLSEVKDHCISVLSLNGFVDDWNRQIYTGRGLMSIELI